MAKIDTDKSANVEGMAKVFDSESIKHADEWDVEMLEFLIEPIEEYIAAFERSDSNIDCYMEDLIGSLRALPEDKDAELRAYYIQGGWYMNG